MQEKFLLLVKFLRKQEKNLFMSGRFFFVLFIPFSSFPLLSLSYLSLGIFGEHLIRSKVWRITSSTQTSHRGFKGSFGDWEVVGRNDSGVTHRRRVCSRKGLLLLLLLLLMFMLVFMLVLVIVIFLTPSPSPQVFRMALNEVPKSGEVWCEGARICLRRGQWSDAKEYLNFAVRFTPQVSEG